VRKCPRRDELCEDAKKSRESSAGTVRERAKETRKGEGSRSRGKANIRSLRVELYSFCRRAHIRKTDGAKKARRKQDIGTEKWGDRYPRPMIL